VYVCVCVCVCVCRIYFPDVDDDPKNANENLLAKLQLPKDSFSLKIYDVCATHTHTLTPHTHTPSARGGVAKMRRSVSHLR